jgi:hypothetical protein
VSADAVVIGDAPEFIDMGYSDGLAKVRVHGGLPAFVFCV